MSYELTIRPRSAKPISKKGMRDGLYALGIEEFESSDPAEALDTGISLIMVVAEPGLPAGVVAIALLPTGWPIEEISDEFVMLAMISLILKADLLDGDILLDVSREGLKAETWGRTVLSPFLARYLRASRTPPTLAKPRGLLIQSAVRPRLESSERAIIHPEASMDDPAGAE